MPLDYPYIRAWHYTSGSFDSYVNDVVTKARSMHAPADSVYERRTPGGEHVGWVTIRALDERHIAEMHAWMESHGLAIPA